MLTAVQSLPRCGRNTHLDRVGVFNDSREVSKKKLRAMRGKVIDVLVEGPSDESEYLLMGRHEGQAPEIDGQVYLTLAGEQSLLPGDFVRARVTHSAEYDLAAEVV